jgi:hypothetical protein
MDSNAITPMQALQILANLSEEAKKDENIGHH